MDMFKFGSSPTYDYSNHVLAGSYKVSEQDIYNTFTDGFGIEHHLKYRTKVSGSFEMFFRTLTEFNTFMTRLNSVKDSMGSYYVVTVAINNTNQTKQINCHLKFDTIRNKDGANDDFMEKFTVSIEER